MKRALYILISCSIITLQAGAQSYAQKLAETVMTIWKDSLAMEPGKPVKWAYDQGVVLKGIEGLWKRTGDGRYFNYIQKSMDYFVKEDGTIRTYKQSDYNIDNVLDGRNLLMLYEVTGKEKYYKAAATLRQQLQTQPRTNEGGFWHKKRYPWQMWLDGLYMGEPFYAEWARTFHEDTAFNDIARQFVLMERHARDANTGLLYHGYDESKEQQWANKTTGRSAEVWARAMGWYGMALVDVLESFPAHHPQHNTLVQILNRYATAIAHYQDAKTGLWWDIVNKGGQPKNYPEASASSMFVYTLAKGVRLGYLPHTFLPVAQKGYSGIISRFVKADASGQTALHGTVSVSGLGGNPYRDGSYAYYMSEKVVVNDPKGVGAFLMASNEIEMIPILKKGAGKTVLLDNYFNHETKTDITGTPIVYHYVWDEMDNNGYAMFGSIFNRYGVQTNTLQQAPTAQNLKGADIYIIVDPDSEKESAHPNFIQPGDADVIYNWVKEGGVLLLFGNDSGNVELQHFNQLAQKFGIRFNYDNRNRVTGSQFEMGAFQIPASNAVFKTAGKVYIKEYASQTLSAPAKAIFMDGDAVAMSVAKVGKGTVFAVGDPWFYNEYVDGRKLPESFHNYAAAEDLVKWAIDQTAKKK